MIPRELVFHAAVGNGGLPDLIADRISLEAFVERMATFWWTRSVSWDPTVTRGLHKTIPADRFRAALDRFADAYPADGVDAARALMDDLLNPVAEEAGKAGWIEMSPTNILAAPLLYTLFPDMKLIHTVRDGRDVACSMIRLPWGGNTMSECIGMWEQTLRDADPAMRQLPSDRVLVLQFEDLVANDRERSYSQVLDFLELEDEPGMREFFETQITAEYGHLGRWKTELSRSGRLAATARYARSLRRLAQAQVSARPPLRALRARPTVVEYHAGTERIDPWADGRARGA
jgi:hypothetical protein